MVENWAEWASGHGQLTKIELSDSCVGKTITTRCNLGIIAMNLKVIWGMSDKTCRRSAAGATSRRPRAHRNYRVFVRRGASSDLRSSR
jgi:hypothetical protein